MRSYLYLLIIISCWGCTQNSTIEKYQNKRAHIINIHDKVKEIKIEDVLIGNIAVPYSFDKYLIISDHRSYDKLIHVFDKKNFNHITSFGYQGEGPSEITVLGHLEFNEKKREIYVADHGKHCILSYNLDSIITNPNYTPLVKLKIREREFPDRFHYINDSLSIARIISINRNHTFNQSIAKWNMSTGEMSPMKYSHPNIERKRAIFSVSLKDNIYVECYRHHDLMTICSLDGDLKYNIYGSKWDNKTSNRFLHYGGVSFAGDYIIASYSGKDNTLEDYRPTCFIIFNKTGDYLKTIETGYRIDDFCYDKDNNRIIMVLNDNIQFAYFDLNYII